VQDGRQRRRLYKQLLKEVHPGTGSVEADTEILLMRGESHLSLGELDLADSAFAKAAQLWPKDSAPLLGKASVRLKRDDFKGAEAEAAAAAQLEPKDPKVWLVTGSIAHARGDIQAALSGYEKALSLYPSDDAAQLARLGALIDLHRDAEAVKAARKYLADYPHDPRAAYLLAVVLTRSADKAGALQALNKAYALLSPIPEEVLQTRPPSLLLAGVVAFSLGKLEEAHARLERYIAAYPPAPGARKLLAAVLMKQDDTDGAIKVLDPLLKVEPDDLRLLLMLGEAYMREGRHYPAEQLFERAVRLQPKSAEARVSQAVNQFASGQEDAALGKLATLFEERPAAGRVGSLLAELYIEQGNARKAAKVAERLVELKPDNPAYRNQLALALAGSGRMAEAREALLRILARKPTYTAAQLNLAKLDLLADHAADAAARYQGVLDRKPDEPRATIGLAQSLAAQRRRREAVDLLEKVERAQGKIADNLRLDAAIAEVDVLLADGQPKKALAAAQRAELIDPDNARVLTALGNAHLALGDKAVAQNLYGRVATDASYDPLRLFQIARLQYRADDLGGALWSVTKAVEAQPQFTEARVKQVELLLALGKRDKALAAARALAADQPRAAGVQRVLGDALTAANDLTGALGAYQRALELAPSANAVIRVYHAHLALGQAKEARALLLERLKRAPDERRVRSALAEDYLGSGEWAQARRQYEILVEGGAGTAAQHNNLAMIYLRQGDPRARRQAERAIELDPDSPTANDTLGWLLVQSNQASAGLGYLRKAEARAAQNPEIRYHIGATLQRLGRTQEARVAFERALASANAFEGRQDAHALLDFMQSKP
jgi:putative PEP-CTERM system TPR-repeat lipoprotein